MTWDQVNRDRKGKRGALPHCSVCGASSVLDPCRACADTETLMLYPAIAGDDRLPRDER